MPQHPRVYAQGLLYHLMARGNDGRTIFAKDSGYEAFLERLAAARQRYPLKSADARVFNLKNILRTCAGLLVGRHNAWAFPSPLQNSLPVASKKCPERSVLRSPYPQQKQSPGVDENGRNRPRMFADERGRNRLRRPNVDNKGDLSRTYGRCLQWICNGTGFAMSFHWTN